MHSPHTHAVHTCKHLLASSHLHSLTCACAGGVLPLTSVKSRRALVVSAISWLTDLGAASAAHPGCVHDRTLSVPSNSVLTLHAWPAVLPPLAPAGGTSPEPYSVSDLRASLSSHFGPHLKTVCMPHTKTTALFTMPNACYNISSCVS